MSSWLGFTLVATAAGCQGLGDSTSGVSFEGDAGSSGASGSNASGAAGSSGSGPAQGGSGTAGSAVAGGAGTSAGNGGSDQGAAGAAGTSSGAAGQGGSGSAGAQSGGSSGCAADLTSCSGACVDLSQDELNCGICGKACASGASCTAGACECSSGSSACANGCSNLQSDAQNCGKCGTVCAAGSVCNSGACAPSCGAGTTLCGSSCASLSSDIANCGTCGHACPAGQSCSSGACACSGGQTLCGNTCVATQTDTKNCGACGKACASGATCNAGTCTGPTTGKVFGQCRFHFGAIDSFAKANGLAAQLDQFTPGWMGTSDTFNQKYVCDEGNAGGALANQVPVIVAYVAAFYSKRHLGRCDCNVNTCGTNNNLCHFGSADIQQNMSAILNVYKSYAQGFAACYGTTRPIVFEMEPDFYQYTLTSQSAPWSAATAGSVMGQFVDAIRQYLPNAVFSMDISPWVGPSNGSDQGKQWYGNFDMSKFTFINTSGGSTLAANTKIRSSNQMTWAGVSSNTGKPILADTGYGANGVSAGHDANWDSPSNINARMADGVVSITQYNPNSSWATTISQIRGQLNAPKFCP